MRHIDISDNCPQNARMRKSEFPVSNFRKEINAIAASINRLDREIVIIFLSVAVLQTLSWYFTSLQFFRSEFTCKYFSNDANADLYGFVYWFIGDCISLFVIPLLVIKILFKKSIKEYGIQFGDFNFGLKVAIAAMLVMLPVIWVMSSRADFASQYPQLFSAKTDWIKFIIYETALFMYLFSWEFIWRGFMLFGLEKKFGFYAIFMQMIPFVILHNGKPVIETLSAIVGAVVLGIIALRTRSFIYGVIMHFGIVFSIDLISILRYKTGDFGIGVSALVKILSRLF